MITFFAFAMLQIAQVADLYTLTRSRIIVYVMSCLRKMQSLICMYGFVFNHFYVALLPAMVTPSL